MEQEESTAAISTAQDELIASTSQAAAGADVVTGSASGTSSMIDAPSQIKVYKPLEGDTSAYKAPQDDLPDSYFVPTAAEAQRAHAGQVRQRERLTGGPLLTKKLRDQQAQREAASKRRWTQTKIRIRFGDRTQIETTLSASATLKEVYDFTRSSLSDVNRSEPFYLYQTPPRRVFSLDDESLNKLTLAQLELVPASVFYIRFANEDLNDGHRSPPIRAELISKAEALPLPAAQPAAQQLRVEPEQTVPRSSGNSGGPAKVPKWLKLKK
ncbi:uncharacterized protein L969DRAFT_90235 [Mixia osmundae IAM 14324]|uniref:uncharacterized protein n=1 Tax=Mixia osmundae (strain CBS 9802 / IAM 14324 / JCM 22182 / KY 12970) TaxID=764103 RepID=UPI0004A556FB|nr:uncharacterized protein L969DRAFT_90235 [Mixia osmundae IAM 14324]KEI37164.1 hypothetical protein L969DRAFT_90235 [Mixia osmundae IAM 14324]